MGMIPSAFEGVWLALVSLTSVGYGRLYPKTWPGRCISIFSMLFGSFYLAMPLYIIGGSFYQTWKKEQAKDEQLKRSIMNSKLGSFLNAPGARTKPGEQLFPLSDHHCEGVWKYKNIAFTVEKVSGALKSVLERIIAEGERKHRFAQGNSSRTASGRSASPSHPVRKQPSEKPLSEEELTEKIKKFSRSDAAWSLAVEHAEVQPLFQAVSECQLGHLNLSKLVRHIDEGMNAQPQPRGPKKRMGINSIFRPPPATT